MPETRQRVDLIPHPLNGEIYGDAANLELIDSIKSKGILHPLLIAHDNRIISGHRRWAAANLIGLDVVPVTVFESQDELDIQEAIIECNRQREKTGEQIGREYKNLKRILNERDSQQGSNQYREKQLDNNASVQKNTEAKSRPTQKAADAIGSSKSTANKAEQVVNVIDSLKEEGETEKADKLRTQLNHSVSGAYNKVKTEGLLNNGQGPSKPPDFGTVITMPQWQSMTIGQRSEALLTTGDKTFNQTNDNIEWARWSWNPITGCLHNCAYCYARDIANRRFSYLEDGERFSPVFYPDRLTAPANTKFPDLNKISDPVERMGKQNVFVCSMADLFGKWVPVEWIEAVLAQIHNNPQWTFLLLTKFPVRMAEFTYPANVWLGTSVDYQWAVERAEKAFTRIKASGFGGVCWLSCEPMMERLTFNIPALKMFDWVVYGGSSASTQTAEYRPPFDDIAHLYNQARIAGCKVYQKTNLIPGMSDTQRIREYPGED